MKIQNGKTLIKCWQNQKLKHNTRTNNRCQIPDFIQAFFNVENNGLNLFL